MSDVKEAAKKKKKKKKKKIDKELQDLIKEVKRMEKEGLDLGEIMDECLEAGYSPEFASRAIRAVFGTGRRPEGYTGIAEIEVESPDVKEAAKKKKARKKCKGYVGGYSDDAETINHMIAVLKSYKVRARIGYTPYVGHRALEICGEDMPKAKEVLVKEFGPGGEHVYERLSKSRLLAPGEEEENEDMEEKEAPKKKPRKLTVGEIWRAGIAITGGFGLWGSHGLYEHKHPKMMVSAWTNALRAKGYSDKDIVLYGDWTDARHLADAVEKNTSYNTFKKYVTRSARDAKYVKKENEGAYKEQLERHSHLFRAPETEEVKDADAKPNYAYVGVMLGPGETYGIGRADEGTRGYTPIYREGTFDTYAEASARADEMNKEIGLTGKEAIIIVLGTMRKKAPDKFLADDKIHWKDIPKDAVVTLKKGVYYVMDPLEKGVKKMVYWTGREARDAPSKLGKMVKKAPEIKEVDDMTKKKEEKKEEEEVEVEEPEKPDEKPEEKPEEKEAPKFLGMSRDTIVTLGGLAALFIIGMGLKTGYIR